MPWSRQAPAARPRTAGGTACRWMPCAFSAQPKAQAGQVCMQHKEVPHS
jgi:hypothetical protein